MGHLAEQLSPWRWARVAASAPSRDDAFDVVRRDLEAIGFGYAAIVHDQPFGDVRFPDAERLQGVVVDPAFANLCRGTEAVLPVQRGLRAGGDGVVTPGDFRGQPVQLELVHAAGFQAGAFFVALDRKRRQSSILLGAWYRSPAEFERVLPLVRERLQLGAACLREGFAVRRLADEHERPVLSPREYDCLAWAALGRPTKVIADRMRLSEATVDEHIARATRKLGASNRTQACARAFLLDAIEGG